MYIIMLGPPGSGKGTQADLLAETLNCPHISSGDLLRANDDLPDEIKAQIAAGAMLKDEDVLDLVKNRLQKDDAKLSWILDGFPRTLSQAEHLHKMLPDLEVIAIYLVIPDEKIKERLTSRRTCKKCRAIYNLINNKPKVENICDACGGELFMRDDDQPEVIENRLKVYRDMTAPLIDFYKKISRFIEIDCSEGQGPEEVDEMIKEALGLSST